MLLAIGEDPLREGLMDTPDRVVRMWKEIYKGYDINNKPKITTFNNGSDGIEYDEMINDTGHYYSQCEHHMVPFFGQYFFAYIPDSKGKLLGLSKVARIVDYYSSKLQVQERLTTEIIECLWKELCKDTIYKPLGMALVMDGKHLCKCMRGVRNEGIMRTTVLKGVFKTDASARAEFLGWVNATK